MFNNQQRFAGRYDALLPLTQGTHPSHWVMIGLLAASLALTLRTSGWPERIRSAESTVAEASSPTPVAANVGLNATMAAALDAVAQRYRVAPEALQPVFLAAQQAAKDFDPLLVIAVIGIESGFNPYAQSVMGAQGLMQVIPRYHRDKLPPDAPEKGMLDPVSNVIVGTKVLQEAIRRQGSLVDGLQYYAGAIDDPERGYSARVIAEKQKLEQAVKARKIPSSTPARPMPGALKESLAKAG